MVNMNQEENGRNVAQSALILSAADWDIQGCQHNKKIESEKKDQKRRKLGML